MEFLLPSTPTDTRYINLFISRWKAATPRKEAAFSQGCFRMSCSEIYATFIPRFSSSFLIHSLLVSPAPHLDRNQIPVLYSPLLRFLSPTSVPSLPEPHNSHPCLASHSLCVLLTSCSTSSSFPPFISSLWPSHCLEGCDLVGFSLWNTRDLGG